MSGSALFIIIVLISGAFAGLVHGTVNFVIVEPYLDYATTLEGQALLDSGGVQDAAGFWVEYEQYRAWQKGGQIIAGIILGTSVGSLFGIVFALSRNSLPGGSDVKRALVLAGIMWFTMYVVPFLKYPPELPGEGNGETVVARSVLYLSFVAISGLGALGSYRISRVLAGRKKLVCLAVYAGIVCSAFVLMPAGSDSAPVDTSAAGAVAGEYRAVSAVGVTSFWASVGLVLGLLWRRLGPYKQTTNLPYK